MGGALSERSSAPPLNEFGGSLREAAAPTVVALGVAVFAAQICNGTENPKPNRAGGEPPPLRLRLSAGV